MLQYFQFPIPLSMNKSRNPRVHLPQNSCLLSRSSRSQLFSWLKKKPQPLHWLYRLRLLLRIPYWKALQCHYTLRS